jgi:hypothetical protein
MHLAVLMTKTFKGGFSRTTIKETQFLIEIPCSKLREENKQGVEIPRHNKVNTGIDRHPAILRHH